MKVVAVACARDEIDIIEPFVRHTLACVDHLVVLDNGSSDGTSTVLQKLRAEGLPLEIVHDPSPGKYLSRRVTRLMHEHALGRHAADWVLPLDADELVIGAEGERLVPEDLNPDQPLQLAWRNYVPHESDDPAQLNPVVRLRHRLEATRIVTKVLVPARLARRPEAVIAQGNHALELNGRRVEGPVSDRLFLAHFPVRTPGQLVAKTVIGYLQNAVMVQRPVEAGFHHQNNFEQLMQDPDAFCRNFVRAAQHYATRPQNRGDAKLMCDPVAYQGGPLRYTPRVADSVRTWQPILRYIESLAHDYGLLRAALTERDRLDFDALSWVFGHNCSQLGRLIQTQHVQQQMALHQQEEVNRLQAELADCRRQLQRTQEELEAARARAEAPLARLVRALAARCRRLRSPAARPAPWH